MIVADTNVVSEPLKTEPDKAVLDWLARHRDEIALSAITVGELWYGAMRLAAGRRRDGLVEAIDALVTRAGDRVLPYDQAAARHYGWLRAARTGAGHVVSVEDTMIAAICKVGGHAIATRNVRDFDGCGLVVHNPWVEP